MEPLPSPDEPQPWWNDGNKMGGLTATVIFLVVLAIIVGLTIKFLFWLF